jgi:hypothetical protein
MIIMDLKKLSLSVIIHRTSDVSYSHICDQFMIYCKSKGYPIRPYYQYIYSKQIQILDKILPTIC